MRWVCGAFLGLLIAGPWFPPASLAQSNCVDPSTQCGALIDTSCLARAGAGSLPADAPAACATQFGAYRECLADFTRRCGGGAPTPVPEAGAIDLPLGHQIVAETPVRGGRFLFILSAEPLSWSAAEQAAVAMGGRLAVIETAAKQQAMSSVLARRPELFHSAVVLFANWVWGPWIGGYQRAGAAEPAEGWVWSLDPVSGADAPVSGAYWFEGQPNNFGGAESYMQIFCINRPTCDTWNDAPADAPVRSYIVELLD